MTPQWHFKAFLPGDRARNSQVEKFFRSDAVEDACNAVIREGIQNSLDAADDSHESVSLKVRITLGEVPAARVRKFYPGLFDHLTALQDKLPDIPNPNEPVRFLAFEDFNTTGLRGDPEQWEPVEGQANAFFNFFRGEGVSDKSEHHRGRHGVGKMVFSAASRVSGAFGRRPSAT